MVSFPLSPLFPSVKTGKHPNFPPLPLTDPTRVHSRVISFPSINPSHNYRPIRRSQEEDSSPAFKAKRRNAMKNSYVGIVAVAARTEKGRGAKGMREVNQDSYGIVPNFMGTQGAYLLSLSDGHGIYGHFVSSHVCQTLPTYLTPVKGLSAADIQREASSLLREAADKLQRSVSRATGYSAKYSGGTMVAVLVQDKTLVCANVGDSRAILVQMGEGEEGWGWRQLTTDHKPDLITERRRIESQKGLVEPLKSLQGEYLGPARVWIPGEDAPGLAMSRSIGDEVAHKVGVSEVPEVLIHGLTSKDRAIVIASDGLWDVLSNTEVAMIVERQWTNCEVCCLELITTAGNRWKRAANGSDDVTVVVATLSC